VNACVCVLGVTQGAFTEQTDLTDDSLSYGLIFDCGSSGTRVYIYFWPPHSGDTKELLDLHQVIGADTKPASLKISPGRFQNNIQMDTADLLYSDQCQGFAEIGLLSL